LEQEKAIGKVPRRSLIRMQGDKKKKSTKTPERKMGPVSGSGQGRAL